MWTMPFRGSSLRTAQCQNPQVAAQRIDLQLRVFESLHRGPSRRCGRSPRAPVPDGALAGPPFSALRKAEARDFGTYGGRYTVARPPTNKCDAQIFSSNVRGAASFRPYILKPNSKHVLVRRSGQSSLAGASTAGSTTGSGAASPVTGTTTSRRVVFSAIRALLPRRPRR